MASLFYLGPELTFSHEAARRLQRLIGGWETAELVPCQTAAEVYERVLTRKGSGAVVPIYNREQGDVYDFSRFFLLDLAATLDLSVSFYLYGRAESLDEIDVIYTKDTIVPQVSRWLETLPPRIRIVAQPDISSAGAAGRAAAEERAAAICSEAAGSLHNLRQLAAATGNRPDNFTRFGLFIRPQVWWEPPEGLFDRREFPLGFNDESAALLARGWETVYWSVALSPQTVLHLGHLTALLSLRKFARMGNRALVLWRPAAPGLTPAGVARFEAGVRQLVDGDLLADFRQGGGEKPLGWIAVSGLESVQRIRMTGRRGILLEHVPGRDGYAKMSTSRGNTIPWPLPAGHEDDPVVKAILEAHFDDERLLLAGRPDLLAMQDDPAPG